MEYSGEHFDVIVIGAGIMGSSTAYQTAKRGLKTLLLEQFDFLHHRGSSHGESRTLRATYPESYYSDMVIESSRLWQQAEAEIGYKVYFQTPQFDMGPSDNTSLESAIKNCEANSIRHRVLDPAQVCDHFSRMIRIPENWVGLLTDLGGVIKPTKAVAMYQTLAMQNGAVLKDNVEVKDVQRANVGPGDGTGVLITTTGGLEFRCKTCVLTVGAWINKLVKSVTVSVSDTATDLPISPLEASVCYWRIKDGHESRFSIGEKFPTFASYGAPYVYGTPSFEYPGLLKVAIHGGFGCDPDKRRFDSTKGENMESLKQWIRDRFGGLVEADEGPVMVQSCMYSMTVDEDFVVDHLGGGFGKDVVIGGGFSGHGFKMAPVIGKLMADLVIHGEAKGEALKYFGLGRFSENGGKGNLKDFDDQVNSFSLLNNPN